MPNLPTSLTFTVETLDDLVCSKANQDNFGVTYRGSLTTASQRVVGIIKVTHRDEGNASSPKERHIVDCTFTHYPTDGSPSYTNQNYYHQIRRKGDAYAMNAAMSAGMTNMLDGSHADGIGLLDWGI